MLGMTWWLWAGEGRRALPTSLIIPPISGVAEVLIAQPQGWAVTRAARRNLGMECLAGRRAMPLPNATGKAIFSIRLRLYCLDSSIEPRESLRRCGKGCLTEKFFQQPVFF